MKKEKIKNKSNFWGIVLIIIGGTFFLNNFISIHLPHIEWKFIWPLIILGIGIKKVRDSCNQSWAFRVVKKEEWND